MAARTTSLRLGTYVYLLGLRHPFITARAFGTLDWVSGGRAVIGRARLAAGGWEALGIDPATRGARLDEAIGVCRRLWIEEAAAHDGPHFPFRRGGLRAQAGSATHPDLHRRRVVAGTAPGRPAGHGPIGMTHTPDSVAARLAVIRDEREQAGRPDLPFEVTVGGECASEDDVLAWEAAGSTASSSRPGAARRRRSRRWPPSRTAYPGLSPAFGRDGGGSESVADGPKVRASGRVEAGIKPWVNPWADDPGRSWAGTEGMTATVTPAASPRSASLCFRSGATTSPAAGSCFRSS